MAIENRPIETIGDVGTISELYGKDLDQGDELLLPYPTSDPARDSYPNQDKFYIQDGSTADVRVSNGTRRVLEPGRHAALLGRGIKGLVTQPIPDVLIACLKDQFDFDPETVEVLPPETYCDVINAEQRRVLTLFPYDRIHKDRCVIDPEKHYRLLSKEWLITGEFPSPESHIMNFDNDLESVITGIRMLLKTPRLVKTLHGLSGDGQKIAREPKDLSAALDFIEAYARYQPLEKIILQDLIPHTINHGIQFYLSKSGTIRLMGVANQVVDREGHYMGGLVNYDENIPAAYTPIIQRAASLCFQAGYFGIVGLDIITDQRDDEPKVIDANLRLTGMTPAYLLKPKLTSTGNSRALLSTEFISHRPLDETLAACRTAMNYNILAVLSALQVDGSRTKVYGVIAGKDEGSLAKNRKRIENCGLVIPGKWEN